MQRALNHFDDESATMGVQRRKICVVAAGGCCLLLLQRV